MSKKLTWMVCAALLSFSSFNVQALPLLSMPAQTAAPDITWVRLLWVGLSPRKWLLHSQRHGLCALRCCCAAYSSGAALCSPRGGGTVGVPLWLLPRSVWPLLALLNRPDFMNLSSLMKITSGMGSKPASRTTRANICCRSKADMKETLWG